MKIKGLVVYTYLVLLFPVPYVLNRTTPAGIYIIAWFDEHIICRDDIRNRRKPRILSRDPHGNRNIVRSAAKRYGK